MLPGLAEGFWPVLLPAKMDPEVPPGKRPNCMALGLLKLRLLVSTCRILACSNKSFKSYVAAKGDLLPIIPGLKLAGTLVDEGPKGF